MRKSKKSRVAPIIADLTGKQPDPNPQKIQGDWTEDDGPHWLTLHFSAEKERTYLANLWERESWRFVVTNCIITSVTCAYLLVQRTSEIARSHQRMGTFPAAVAAVPLAGLNFVALYLLNKEQEEPRPWLKQLWLKTRTACRVVAVSGGLVIIGKCLFNLYYFCATLEASKKLPQCHLFEFRVPPSDVIIYVLFAPLILQYMNFRFTDYIVVCLMMWLMLLAIIYKLICDEPKMVDSDIKAMNVNPISASQGLLIFALWPWLVIFISRHLEVTDRRNFLNKELERKRHASNLVMAQLASKSRAQQSMISFLCHEIRNPYNGLVGYAELAHKECNSILELQRQIKGNCCSVHNDSITRKVNRMVTDVRDWSDTVTRSSRHMLELLDNVLDLSKLENKMMVLKRQPLNLHSLCKNVQHLLAPTILEEVQMIVDVPTELWVFGDRLRWQQILVNLLANAIKFTTWGYVYLGIKRMSTHSSRPLNPVTHIEGWPRRRQRSTKRGISSTDYQAEVQEILHVEISDSGCGVPAELQEKIFSEFEQGSSLKPGSGVGLALSQNIAALFGGRIEVKSPYSYSSPLQRWAVKEYHSQTRGDDANAEGELCQGTRMQMRIPYEPCSPAEVCTSLAADDQKDVMLATIGAKRSRSSTRTSTDRSTDESTDDRTDESASTISSLADVESNAAAEIVPMSTLHFSKLPRIDRGWPSSLGKAWPWQMHVLLVEDDLMNQIIMQAKMQEAVAQLSSVFLNSELGQRTLSMSDAGLPKDGRLFDVKIEAVDTAEKALELVAKHDSASGGDDDEQFGLVLMDQHLQKAGGVLRGEEATEQLRKSNFTAPIIMCTGNCGAEDRANYLKAGATCIWPKPYPTVLEMADSIFNLLFAPQPVNLQVTLELEV